MAGCKRITVWISMGIISLIFASIIQVSALDSNVSPNSDLVRGQALDFKVGQVRGHSDGSGWGIADANVTGLTPEATAYVALMGWSFKSDSASRGNIAIWTQRYLGGDKWDWGLEHKVGANGEIKVRFIGIYGDKDNTPFDFLVNYLIITK